MTNDNAQDKFKEILASNLKACNMQAKSLQESFEDISEALPFKPKDIENLTKEKRYIIDSLTLSFSRLQDMLGSKIFSTILKLEAEPVGTMIDILNKMEKMRLLDSVNEWQNIREARNSIFHEYNYNYTNIAHNLNIITQYVPHILGILAGIEKYVKDKFGIKA